MMRRLKSVFRDEKIFFSRKNFFEIFENFFEIFENFFQLISLKLTLLFQYWIKLFLYRLFECIISKKKFENYEVKLLFGGPLLMFSSRSLNV